MTTNMYTAGLIAIDMQNDFKREAIKQRQWAQAMRAKRNQVKKTKV